MKQTLDANIGGTIFHVEEDAYRRLEAYLASISAFFASFEDRADIVSDIEGRVAEQLAQGNASRIVSLADVEQVIVVLGRVDQIADVDGDAESAGEDAGAIVPAAPSGTISGATVTTSDGPAPMRRRLFRDMERGLIAGVAAGLGAYLRIPPFIIRIVALMPLILVLMNGTASLFIFVALGYLVLWFVVPQAKTTTDALQMHGDPVTIAAVDERLREQRSVIAPGTRNVAVALAARVGAFVRATVLGTAWLACVAAAVGGAAAIVGCTAFLIVSLANTNIGLANELKDFIERLGHWYSPFAFCVYLVFAIPLVVAMMGAISILRKRNLISVRWGVTAASAWLVALFVSVGLWAVYFFPSPSEPDFAVMSSRRDCEAGAKPCIYRTPGDSLAVYVPKAARKR